MEGGTACVELAAGGDGCCRLWLRWLQSAVASSQYDGQCKRRDDEFRSHNFLFYSLWQELVEQQAREARGMVANLGVFDQIAKEHPHAEFAKSGGVDGDLRSALLR